MCKIGELKIAQIHHENPENPSQEKIEIVSCLITLVVSCLV